MTEIDIIAQNFDIYQGDGLDKFARTGKISSLQIHKAGAQGVILGHSEVGDSPAMINEKLLTILKYQRELKNKNFLKKIIVLIGENWEEFEKNETPEANLVNDLDKVEMVLQALEYKKDKRTAEDLEEFFETSGPRLKTEIGKLLWEEIKKRYSEVVK